MEVELKSFIHKPTGKSKPSLVKVEKRRKRVRRYGGAYSNSAIVHMWGGVVMVVMGFCE